MPRLSEGHEPAATLTPPVGNLGTSFDLHGNYWTLVPNESDANRTLYVLPAQANDTWQVDTLSGLPASNWRWVQADEFGFIWIASSERLLRLDPHTPADGWMDISANEEFPNEPISALSKAPSGAILVAFETGLIGEVDYCKVAHTPKEEVQFTSYKAPASINELLTDADGNVWARANDTIFRAVAAHDAWQKNWEVVARMPGGTHDLSGCFLDGKFYMEWAISADFGYPSLGRHHSKLLSFDPQNNQWSIVTDFGLPRGYCGTGTIDGKIWTIGGISKDENGESYDDVLTQIYDPKTETLTTGPELPESLASTLALNAAGRIYVMGYPHGSDLKLRFYSIGSGETEWRIEEQGPLGYGSLYGTVLDDKLYVLVPHTYLAIYDPSTRTWDTTETPNSTRSPQIGPYKGEVWVMGGRNAEAEDGCYIYNPTTKSWRKGPPLPRKLSWGCGFNFEGQLYLNGGTGGRGYSNTTYRLRPQE